MHKQPSLTVDCVVFDDKGRLLLIHRKKPPFREQYAFPGGHVEYGETTEAAALRELQEETGIVGNAPKLIGVYSRPGRDPRGHKVTVAYLISVGSVEPTAGDDAASAEFISDWKNLDLAFDHNQILADALKIKVI